MNDPRKGYTSASNAAADALCAGRHFAQRGIPDTKSDDADYGKAVHEALRIGDTSTLTVEQIDIHDSCKAIEQKLVAAYFGENAPVVSWRERRFWVNVQVRGGLAGQGLSQFPHSGQVDVVYRSGDKLLIVDYKVLQGDVADSPKNLQLRDLAVLASGELMLVKEVATAIIQPLVTHTPEVCLYDAEDLKRAETEMFARVAASNAPSAPRKAGELQCKFCLAKTKCAEYSQWSGAMIPAGNSDVLVKELIFQMAMESWMPSQRAVVAGLLSSASKALDEIKDFLKDGIKRECEEARAKGVMLETSQWCPGWSLTAGTKRETITDPQACFDRFAALGGKLDAFMGTVSVGKTKLKEAVHAVTELKGRALDAQVAKLYEGISDVSVSQPSLKKEDA